MVSYSASKRNGSQASFLPRRMLAFAMQGEVAQAGAHGGDSEQQCDPEAVHGVDPLEVGITFAPMPWSLRERSLHSLNQCKPMLVTRRSHPRPWPARRRRYPWRSADCASSR